MGKEEKEIYSLDLGDLVVKHKGMTITGKFETSDKDLFDLVFEEYKKPIFMYIDLGTKKFNLGDKILEGKNAFAVSIYNEKLKKHVEVPAEVAKYREISYKLSLYEQSKEREKTSMPYNQADMMRDISQGASLKGITFISANDYPGVTLPEHLR